MVTAELSHNPYLLNTMVKFDGKDPKINSQIEKYEKLPLKDWVHLVPEIFYKEMNGYDFDLYFTGTRSDYEEIRKAFSDRGIPEDDVRIRHKNEIEDAETKSGEVKALLSWLSGCKNGKFDFNEFWGRLSDQLEEMYPCVVIRGHVPAEGNDSFAMEMVQSAEELINTDLTSTPVVFCVEEEKKEDFRKDLRSILGRREIRKEQLFFWISPTMNRSQVTRVIRDLGVEHPQVIRDYEDELIKAFVRNYPVTEYVRSAIQIFQTEIDRIASDLEKENQENETVNAEVHKKIDLLDGEMAALKETDEFFVQRDDYEAPISFQEAQDTLIRQLSKWKSRKTKIVGEKEIEVAAEDYVRKIQNEMDRFSSSILASHREAWEKICESFAVLYQASGIDGSYVPERNVCAEIPSGSIPEMKPLLLQSVFFEESKNDFLGFFKKANDETVRDMVVACQLENWRNLVLEKMKPIAERCVHWCLDDLSDHYDSLAETYHQHLQELIEERLVEKEKVSSQLSVEERRLQEENDWLSQFKEQLQRIERD